MNDQLLWLAADPRLIEIALCIGVTAILQWIQWTKQKSRHACAQRLFGRSHGWSKRPISSDLSESTADSSDVEVIDVRFVAGVCI